MATIALRLVPRDRKRCADAARDLLSLGATCTFFHDVVLAAPVWAALATCDYCPADADEADFEHLIDAIKGDLSILMRPAAYCRPTVEQSVPCPYHAYRGASVLRERLSAQITVMGKPSGVRTHAAGLMSQPERIVILMTQPERI